ncbi:polyprenyl synthetase family protein [Patescibacteria group bacterium]
MGNFKQTLLEKRKLVWQEIKDYLEQLTVFPDYCRVDDSYQALVNFHHEVAFEYPYRKGKYFRPTLLLLTTEAMGFDHEKAIKTAAAMQMSEDWILVHDDVEDQSLKRRGKPTLHEQYSNGLAVNAGDALHVLMWEILNDNFSIISHQKAMRIIKEFCVMLKRTTLGQTTEIKWATENKLNLTEEDIYFIMESKTVYYTCAGPMRLGAILAGASSSQLNSLYQFGRALGYCFQIRDDLLDLVSDFRGLKKQKGNDIWEGKRTIILAHLLAESKGKDRQKLIEILKKKRESKTQNEIDWVLSVMEKYGSLEYAGEQVTKFQAEAHRIFDRQLSFLSQQPARDQLKQAIDFVATRKH